MASYINGVILPVDGGSWASSGWVRDRKGAWVLAELRGTEPMKFNIPLPFDRTDEHAGEFHTVDAVAQVGAAIERAGFEGALVTDHPAPTVRWLETGGHQAQDPFVMLSLLAAVAKRIKLQTGILVLPYRNPFITARAIATLDRFSNGRVILGMAVGYLKGEYKALGVDFDTFNDIMDEYLKVLKLALSGDEFTFEGSGYQAFGNRIQPCASAKAAPAVFDRRQCQTRNPPCG